MVVGAGMGLGSAARDDPLSEDPAREAGGASGTLATVQMSAPRSAWRSSGSSTSGGLLRRRRGVRGGLGVLVAALLAVTALTRLLPERLEQAAR